VLASAPERATAVLTSQARRWGRVFVLRKLSVRDGLGRFGAQAGWRTPDGFAHGIAVRGQGLTGERDHFHQIAKINVCRYGGGASVSRADCAACHSYWSTSLESCWIF
jgi:hypothetical protein